PHRVAALPDREPLRPLAPPRGHRAGASRSGPAAARLQRRDVAGLHPSPLPLEAQPRVPAGAPPEVDALRRGDVSAHSGRPSPAGLRLPRPEAGPGRSLLGRHAAHAPPLGGRAPESGPEGDLPRGLLLGCAGGGGPRLLPPHSPAPPGRAREGAVA